MSGNKLIHAFTSPGCDAPPYINISRLDDGSVRVIVRGKPYPDLSSGTEEIILSAQDWRSLAGAVAEDAYDRGRRDVLNALLSLNPEVAQRLHDIRSEGGEFSNLSGKLPFDVAFWVTAVAEQLRIEPLEAP